MTIKEFSDLPDDQKARLLHKSGTYIGKRKLAATAVVLYQVEGFYVEVFYHQYRRVIECFSCFSGTARLDPYLAQIHVGHLV
jgi:hypothetical protein